MGKMAGSLPGAGVSHSLQSPPGALSPDLESRMAIAAGPSTVSQRLALRFLRLAREAESVGDLRQAITHRLHAVRHDCTSRSVIEYAGFLATTGDRSRAIELLEQEVSHPRHRSTGRPCPRCARALALLHRESRDHREAKRWLLRAAAAEMNSWQAGDATLSAHQLYCEALLAMDAGETTRSRALCNAARVSAEGFELSLVIHQLARLDSHDGNSESAIRHLLEAARIARVWGAHHHYATCIFDLGRTLNSLGRTSTAIECYRIASLRFARVGSTRLAAVAARWLHQSRALARMPAASPELN